MASGTAATGDRPARGAITLIEGGPAPYLRLSGVIDQATVREFRLRVRPASWPARVDLREVTSLDAAGFELLVHLARKQKRTGGELEVVEPPERLRQLMEQTGLTRVSHWVPAGFDGTPERAAGAAASA